MTENADLNKDEIEKIIEDRMSFEASTEKYFKNLQDFQKKLSESLESIRVVKDHSFGLMNNEKYKNKMDKILEEMIDILRDTEIERDSLNKKRYAPMEMEDSSKKETLPETSSEAPSETPNPDPNIVKPF